jgi:hypothetical protein
MIDGSEERNPVFFYPPCPPGGGEQGIAPFQGSVDGIGSGFRYI